MPSKHSRDHSATISDYQSPPPYKPFIYVMPSPPSAHSELPSIMFPPPIASYSPTSLAFNPSDASRRRSSRRRCKHRRHADSSQLLDRFYPQMGAQSTDDDLHFELTIKNRTYVIETLQYLAEPVSTKSSYYPSAVAFIDGAVKSYIPRTFTTPPTPTTSSSSESGRLHVESTLSRFVISPANQKGLGMFSQKEISLGEVIVAEQPLAVTPLSVGLSDSLSEVYNSIFDLLCDESYEEAMSLSQGLYAQNQEGSKIALDIIRTKSLLIDLGGEKSSVTHRAIFPSISRCNHRWVTYFWCLQASNLHAPSCSPNARAEWNTASFTFTLRAVRPIQAREEITISYLALRDLLRPHQDRVALLQQHFGFTTCWCPTCSMSTPSALFHSDKARHALLLVCLSKPSTSNTPYIQHIPLSPNSCHHDLSLSDMPSFQEWCTNLSLEDDLLSNGHRRILRVMENEGLHVLIPEEEWGKPHIDELVMCYGALADLKHFKKWVKRGMVVRSVKEGGASHKAVGSGGAGLSGLMGGGKVLERWLAHPESFPVWGWRQPQGDSKRGRHKHKR